MLFREAIERDALDLLALAERVAAQTGHDPFDGTLHRDLVNLGNDHLAQERRLEAAALTLRRAWLKAAHRPGDTTLKSPRDGDMARVPCGDSLQFGYERDLDVSILEDRGATYAPPPTGWTSDTVIFRSGQAALATILQFVASAWGDRRTLSVAHAGAYFETTALLDTWPRRNFRPTGPSVVSADVVIGEPVWCNGSFAATKRLPRARRVLLIDTTMIGPACDLDRWLLAAGDDCQLAIAFSSGLKLDQAGLELANVGIARVLMRDGTQRRSEIAGRLRQLRGLMATGLTLDELSALSAPWFLDRAYCDNYVAAIFANNRALAHAIGRCSPVFEPLCHPALTSDADAPFCAVQLREPSPSRYRRFVEIVEQQCHRRGLLLTKGGSFGFRGHRFELIEPAPGQGHPFLRLAMGWRDGYSCRGLAELFGELASHKSFVALDRAYGR
jgi:hypothetical protein